MSLINREALYEKACDLEAQALAHVGKIANDETKIEEWKIWSAILIERTAFKHDIFDAPEELPSAQPEIVHCEECAYRKDNFMGDWCTCWCGWTSLDGYCHKGANKDE